MTSRPGVPAGDVAAEASAAAHVAGSLVPVPAAEPRGSRAGAVPVLSVPGQWEPTCVFGAEPAS